MAKARTGGSDEASRQTARADFKMALHDDCNKSLAKLGPADHAIVLAQLQVFFGAWKEGRSDEDLHQQWDYKVLKGADEKRLKVRQIHLKKHRAVLLIVAEDQTMWVLEVFLKGKAKAQQAAISRAVSRAQELLEGR